MDSKSLQNLPAFSAPIAHALNGGRVRQREVRNGNLFSVCPLCWPNAESFLRPIACRLTKLISPPRKNVANSICSIMNAKECAVSSTQHRHDVWCNIGRWHCEHCGRLRSYCYTHREWSHDHCVCERSIPTPDWCVSRIGCSNPGNCEWIGVCSAAAKNTCH